MADVLHAYAKEHAPTVADPARIGYAIQALLPYWGDRLVSDIKGETCRRYVKSRSVSSGTARLELGALSAALAYCEVEGYITHAPKVWLPEKPKPRDRWLTRNEVARLLRAARAEASPHLARFILVALYTGTRKSAVLGLRWVPSVDSGYVDLERGVLHRSGARARQTTKRQTPARIPRRLLNHLRRWSAIGDTSEFVIEYRGAPVGDIQNGWVRARRRARLGAEVTPHVLRHTAITWAMHDGVAANDAASYFGVSVNVIEGTYWHHHPDFQKSVVNSIDRRGRT